MKTARVKMVRNVLIKTGMMVGEHTIADIKPTYITLKAPDGVQFRISRESFATEYSYMFDMTAKITIITK